MNRNERKDVVRVLKTLAESISNFQQKNPKVNVSIFDGFKKPTEEIFGKIVAMDNFDELIESNEGLCPNCGSVTNDSDECENPYCDNTVFFG